MKRKRLTVEIYDLGEHFLAEFYGTNTKLIFHNIDEVLDAIGEKVALLSIIEEDKDDQEKTECEVCDPSD